MKQVYADAFYWIALTDPKDNWHEIALEVSREFADVQLVSTEAVLIEYVNFFSRYGASVRRVVVETVHDIVTGSDVLVVPQTRSSLLAGMTLHANRPDKTYSLRIVCQCKSCAS